MPRGGNRPNAGRPRGSKSLTTQQREAVEAAVITVVQQQAAAQVAAIAQETAQALVDRETVRQAARAIILPHLKPLIEAQITNAGGLKYLVTRDKKTGKFIRVTEAMARLKLGKDEELVEVWEKDPNVFAFVELLNRLLDKPAVPVQKHEVTGKLTLEQLVAGSMSESA